MIRLGHSVRWLASALRLSFGFARQRPWIGRLGRAQFCKHVRGNSWFSTMLSAVSCVIF
jgi:hypothetical protein